MSAAIRRLNWGCGLVTLSGWINLDITPAPGVDVVCDIRRGLSFADDTIDYAVGIHALPEIPLMEIEDVLWELRRVLRPGGVLRLGLPDLERAMQAYIRGESGYFLVPDDHRESLGGKLVTQMLWYGRSKSMFTWDFTDELMRKAGFRNVCRCDYRQTSSPFAEIVALDNRPAESLFVEGTK